LPKLTPQPPARLIAIFKRFDFVVSKRNSGDHITMRKPGCCRPLVIPDWREVPVALIQTNLKTAGITRDQFLHALSEL
jgi:hypothetical protein